MVLETQFQTIELAVRNQQAAQTCLDERLINLEGQTLTISDSITTLMHHLNIPSSSSKRRKDASTTNLTMMEDVELTSQPTSQLQMVGGTDF
jgi:hypothetical protein